MNFVLWFVGGWCLFLLMCGVAAKARLGWVRWVEYSIDLEIAEVLRRHAATHPWEPHGRPCDLSTKAVENPFNKVLIAANPAGPRCLVKN